MRRMDVLAGLMLVAASSGLGAQPGVKDGMRLKVELPYLVFPVDNAPKAEKCFVDVRAADGGLLRTLVLPIAAKGPGDWTATIDLRAWMGQEISLVPGKGQTNGLERLARLKPSAVRGDPPNLYDEPNRLQFHFSPPVGFMNDPNGLVYVDGEWRLLYQHAPYTFVPPWSGGNQYWGSATSRDLVHWTDHGDVLMPYPGFQKLISGSGVVDVSNTAGFGANAHVNCVWGGTPRGYGMLLFSSVDGRTFVPDPTNPHGCAKQGFGADPKVVWHEPTKRWISVSWGVSENCCAQYFHSSPDLKHWTYESTYFGDHSASRKRAAFLFECPGLQELRIEGEDKTAWVVWGAGARYSVGDFDGHAFKPYADHERLLSMAKSESLPYYAGQAFQNVPDGRCVFIPWYGQQGTGPHFAQYMGLPQELRLVRTNAGLRLSRLPVRELEMLRDGDGVAFERFEGELVEGRVTVEPTGATRISLDLRGVSVVYDPCHERLSCAGESVYWPLREGKLDLRFFLDRQGLECFSASGFDCWAFRQAQPNPNSRRLASSVTSVQSATCVAWKLKSIWK